MDFFSTQETARRNTKRLVFLFLLAVAGIAVSIYAVLVVFLGSSGGGETGQPPRLVLWDPVLFATVCVGVAAVVGLGSAWKSMQLSSGGGAVAESLGGRLIPSNTSDPVERRIMNVVEEMALASGCPVPQVYMMDRETGINAFAAGFNPSNAAIGVTRGCVENLTRDELQGVMAHEFSHILNGDMRLSTKLIGILFGIFVLSVIGRIIMRSAFYTRGGGDSKNNSGMALVVLGLALSIIGGLGVLCGRMIQSAVSRQREFLADASAVQFTRNPAGIAGALKRIGGFVSGSQLEAPNAQEASHLFFSNGMSASFARMFATHPPLDVRIKKIQPEWDGKFLEPSRQRITLEKKGRPANTPPPIPVPGQLPGTEAMRLPGFPGVMAGFAGAGRTPEQVLEHPVVLTAASLQSAAELREALSESIDFEDPPTAIAVLYSFLLSGDPQVRARQLEFLGTNAMRAVLQILKPAHDAVAGMDEALKLPLVDMLLPTLKQLTPEQYATFKRNGTELIAADGRLSLFEFAITRIVYHGLDIHFDLAAPPAERFHSLNDVHAAANLIFSCLAHLRSGDAADARFHTATRMLPPSPAEWKPVPPGGYDLHDIDRALTQLGGLTPALKKQFLLVAARLVLADEQVAAKEFQLLRVIAESLDTPIPPFLFAAESDK